MWCVVFSSVFKVSNFRSHPVSLLPAVWPHTHGHCAYCYPASAKPPLLPASRHCTSFYCSFVVFIDNFCLPCCPLFFVFLFSLPLSIFPSQSSFFHYVARWITVVFLQLSLWVMRICEGFSHHQPLIGTCDKFTSETCLCFFICENESTFLSKVIPLPSPYVYSFLCFFPVLSTLPPSYRSPS